MSASFKYEPREAHDLKSLSANNSHMLACLEKAQENRAKTGCLRCPMRVKGSSIRLAHQYSRTSVGAPFAAKPSNIVAVVLCHSGGAPELVQVTSGEDPRHCARARSSKAAA